MYMSGCAPQGTCPAIWHLLNPVSSAAHFSARKHWFLLTGALLHGFIALSPKRHGRIAQLVEQRTENPCVPSSSLGLATIFLTFPAWKCAQSRSSPRYWHLVQLLRLGFAMWKAQQPYVQIAQQACGYAESDALEISGAGSRDRTDDSSLGSSRITTILCPHCSARRFRLGEDACCMGLWQFQSWAACNLIFAGHALRCRIQGCPPQLFEQFLCCALRGFVFV